MVYDIRYNVLAAKFKHFNRAPIYSLANFNPLRTPLNALNISKADSYSPLMLVSAGSANYELSLLNLETSSVEVLLTVDERKTKESVLGGIPTVPSYFRESLFHVSDYDYGQPQKHAETNTSVLRRYL